MKSRKNHRCTDAAMAWETGAFRENLDLYLQLRYLNTVSYQALHSAMRRLRRRLSTYPSIRLRRLPHDALLSWNATCNGSNNKK